ncbi:MAG: DNA polymerase III subunit gamma/tau [Chthonomonadales bacterium]|nr:DNA polymerase III subunit gamma/tau [Chthonomonadales bacterium]
MAYLALYRKYRSQSFDELIGQQHVTTVLRNALRLGRVAHAYLFCGPRGCGKTSTARLLARALNCLAAPGPTEAPCGACEMCARIREGSAIDVIEMDAASETGIDDVREKIIENAKYSPAEARFKVYIIDEVHDLSQKAFDSLLKTIEEPPAHVVFVLATTEAHKVPVTVRSRCQRMDFRRGTLADLVANIARVLDAEGLPYEPAALGAVARAAEGSFRDSLSLLEQVLAYADGRLTAEAVHAAIGSVGPEVLDDLTCALASDEMSAALSRAADIVESGKDVRQVLAGLQSHLRDVLVASFCASPAGMPDVSAERFEQLARQARLFSADQLLGMLDVLASAERDLRHTSMQRLLLERALWSALPSRLAARAERAPSERAPASPPASRPANAGAPPTPSAWSTAGERAPGIEPPPRATRAGAAARAEGAPVPPPAGRFAPPVDLEVVRRVWPRVRSRVTQSFRAAGAIFGEEQVVAIEGSQVVVAFPNEFVRSRADKPRAKAVLQEVLCEELGAPGYRVRCELLQPGSQAPPAPSAALGPLDLGSEPEPLPEPVVPTAPMSAAQGAAPAGADEAARRTGGDRADEEFLTLVMDEFNGRIVDD